ncbi:hypothetical protein TNCT_713411 [Trichonephila clavata]|uniref:Uncharacterized protein n=1 Tax=Trichonephila clavata TaxID=2740835 RepID=A0A8X6HZ74_TRICU|nr:hypothetical protein TNCT_713411 [Trichonephila clavata]
MMPKRELIRQESRHHATAAYRFVVDHTNEDAVICNVASKVAGITVPEMIANVGANNAELFERTLVVLQRRPFLNSSLLVYEPEG